MKLRTDREQGVRRIDATDRPHFQCHRRIAGKVRSLLIANGDLASSGRFDVDAWVTQWMRLPMAELNGKTPLQVLKHDKGWAAVELVLERMRGGVCA